MQSRILRAFIAAVVASAFVFPMAAAAAPTEVQKLQEEIKDLQDDVKKAGEDYSAAYWELDKTRAEMAEVDRRIGETETRLAETRVRLGERAAAMYRTGSYEYIEILLSARDFDEMLLRLEYVQRVNEQDASIIDAARTTQTELAAQRSEFETLVQAQAEETARLKKEAERIEGELKAQQSKYESLQKELAAAIAREKAQTGTTTATAGPNGMVFPVRGPNYYNDTWGAARSGGRTHKGTDIMASRGTPAVAVLSGTVRAKENNLGGKTIWLTADNGWSFYYAHLDSYQVTTGRVTAGQVIGHVGSTGNASASAPHLHFEIHPGGGAAVNPYSYLRKMQ
ncbi:MAG: peptidoglycan DD-metalloendopeptidase family protein [Coriobacteriia bacterium]|nr:peptidoglycan DD-metalloendopeptidase family protein [Coriobacteriia bacterium]